MDIVNILIEDTAKTQRIDRNYRQRLRKSEGKEY